MSEALVVLPSQRLEFTQDQMGMIRDSFANGCTPAEFKVLMEVASTRRLNPILKQIYFVKRYDGQKKRDVWSYQVSIDGLRAMADRTGKYDGQDEPEFQYDTEGKLKLAKVKVYRKDMSHAAVGVAHWSEYVQTTREGAVTKMWAEKPHVMLAKCAEAIGFRKAFPEDMGGLYTSEEIAQADEPEKAAPAPAAVVAAVATPAKASKPAPKEAAAPPPVEEQLSIRLIEMCEAGFASERDKAAWQELHRPEVNSLPAYLKKPVVEAHQKAAVRS